MTKTSTKTMTRKNKELVDFFSTKSARVWYRLHANGGDDLCAERVNAFYSRQGGWQNTYAVGRTPAWWESDLDLITGNYHGYREVIEGREFSTTWLQWALENGIAPGQPFLLGIDAPSTSVSYEGEYDEEWDYDLVDIREWPRAYVLKQWERYFRKRDAARALGLRAQKELQAIVLKDVAALYLVSYMSPGDQFDSGYGTRGWKHQLTLLSRRTYAVPYFSGLVSALQCTGYGSDLRAAYDDLIEKACARIPQLSPELIRRMEVRRN